MTTFALKINKQRHGTGVCFTVVGIGGQRVCQVARHRAQDGAPLGAAPEAVNFGESIIKLRREIRYCKVCHNISETEVCPICGNPSRDAATICVVENVKDVMSIENTHQHKGLYHVLGGLISPMDGIGPADIEVDSLEERVKAGGIKEVILALSATMEGDTTNFYIFRRLAPYPDVKITILARGVSVGNEIEYTDELTLGRSILNRTLFSDTFHKE